MPEFLFFYLSLSRNPVCTQEQTGSRTYMSEKQQNETRTADPSISMWPIFSSSWQQT